MTLYELWLRIVERWPLMFKSAHQRDRHQQDLVITDRETQIDTEKRISESLRALLASQSTMITTYIADVNNLRGQLNNERQTKALKKHREDSSVPVLVTRGGWRSVRHQREASAAAPVRDSVAALDERVKREGGIT